MNNDCRQQQPEGVINNAPVVVVSTGNIDTRHRQRLKCNGNYDDYGFNHVVNKKQRWYKQQLYLLGIIYSSHYMWTMGFTMTCNHRHPPILLLLCDDHPSCKTHRQRSNRIIISQRRWYKSSTERTGHEDTSDLQGQLHLDPNQGEMDNDYNNNVIVDGIADAEVTTSLIYTIRQCTSLPQLYDVVKLEYQQATPNSTIVVELTQRFAHLLLPSVHSRFNNNSRSHICTESHELEADDGTEEGNVLKPLLDLITSTFNCARIDQKLQDRYISDTVDCFVALRNVLYNAVRRHPSKSSHYLEARIVPVINLLWNQILEYEQRSIYNTNQSAIVQNMSSKRLVSFLLAIHKCRQYASVNGKVDEKSLILPVVYNMNPTSLIYRHVCLRICHGDRIERLTISDINRILKSINTTTMWSSSHWHVCNNSVIQQLVTTLVRRLRKPTIYNNTSAIPMLIQGLEQMQRLWYSTSNVTYTGITKRVTDSSDASSLSKVTKEIELSIYRLLNYVVNTATEQNKMDGVGSNTTGMLQLSIKEIGTLSVTIRTVLPHDNSNVLDPYQYQHPLVMKFQELMMNQLAMVQDAISSISIQPTIIRDISHIFSTWEYYRRPVVNQQATTNTTDPNHSGHKMIQILGHLIEHMVVVGTDRFPDTIQPKDINSILRVVAFLPKSYSIQSYFSALRYLVTHNDAFLLQCSITVLSNFCWFMAYKSNQYFYDSSIGDEAIVALGNRIVHPDICHLCTPKEACRILSGFTALCCDVKNAASSDVDSCDGDSSTSSPQIQQRHGSLLSTLFRSLGEYLLESSTLSPYDASSAIYAYAKAYYIFDMGIFDHIVDVFATHVMTNPSPCTLRQVCHAIWACGKMISLESSSNDMDFDAIDQFVSEKPPYYRSFINMVSYVTDRADELSVQDITQTLWAMAHFNLFVDNAFNDEKDNVLIDAEPLLNQILTLVAVFNTQERASLLWSFTKMQCLSPLLARIIFLLTRPFAQMSNSNQRAVISRPQEASMILYALGRMNIRDVDVFRQLTIYVLDNHIHAASAQTIANILWAHRTVHIEPPQQLLESWAMLKLPDLNISKSSDSGISAAWSYNEYSFL